MFQRQAVEGVEGAVLLGDLAAKLGVEELDRVLGTDEARMTAGDRPRISAFPISPAPMPLE